MYRSLYNLLQEMYRLMRSSPIGFQDSEAIERGWSTLNTIKPPLIVATLYQYSGVIVNNLPILSFDRTFRLQMQHSLNPPPYNTRTSREKSQEQRSTRRWLRNNRERERSDDTHM